jgi:Domain of unknown function (DUF4280)
MPQNVVQGALMMCTMGQGPPAQLTPVPAGPPVQAGAKLAATVMDFKPMVNIPTFGMCMSPSNPQVAAATSAAMGVLTPQPCVPVTTAPWSPGSATVKVGQFAALVQTDTCQCAWGGMITISTAGQVKAQST